MADSATSSLRLRDQETGANDGQWGTYTDTNFTLVEEALSGVLSKSVAGSADVTLTSTNFTSDESRHAVLELTGALTGNINVIIPNVQKTYFVFNNTSGSFTLGLKTSSGTAVEIPQGSKEYIYCDGSNAIVTLLGTTHSTNVATVAGQITPTNNISTVAGVAANITTVAGVSADVTTVATAVTAGHVETVSSINAAVSSVSSNMPDVATVAGDSANLQTVAGQIAGTNNIATLASISANISTVAGISSAVSTVATNVADVTNFSDVYIGAASSDPSTRTDGSSLTTGDLYFNTSTSALNIYGGSSFQAAALDASSIIVAVSSPTDNAVPRFNGTGGATLQNSAVIIDDSNNVTGVASLTLTTDLAVAHGGTGSSSASAARTALGVAIGSNVQAYDAQLDDIAALALTNGNFIVGDGSNWVAESGATARTSLGLDSMATQANDAVDIDGGSITGITDLAVADGGTGQGSYTNGQLLIGNTSGNTLAKGTITAGANIAITNGAGAVTVAASGVHTQGLQTIWVPAAAMRPTSSNGCDAITDVETTSGRPDMQVLDFDASSDEHAQFSVAFPKSWNAGTVTFQFFWTGTTTDTDGVSFGLQGVSVVDGATIDVAYGTAIVVDDANQSTAEDLYVSAVSGAVTIASAADDAITFFRVFRDVSDANDTAAEDARLVGIKLYYTTDAGNDA